MAVSSSSSLFILFLVFAFAAASVPNAKDYFVGGKPDAWKVPSSESESGSLNKWAESVRFHMGDHLIFTYEAGKDSVYEVSKENYVSCNTSSAIKKHNDGKTKVRFDLSGAYYFISGEKGNCEKGEKVTVVVMSQRSVVSPSPAPAPVKGLAPAPSPKSTANVSQGGGGLMAMGVMVAAMWFF